MTEYRIVAGIAGEPTRELGTYDSERGALRALSAMHEPRYEGWANRETWAVVLWIRNLEPLYRRAVAMAPGLVELIEREGPTAAEDRVQAWIEDEAIPRSFDTGSLAGDLLTGAIGRVDWREVVGAIIGDGIEENA